MMWKTKNFISKISVFLFVFLFLVLPKTVAAGWVENLAVKIAIAPLYYIVWIIVKLMVFLVKFAGSLVNWVLSTNFIRYSYTKPANNPVIQTGLGITAGFANMILVLVLVYVAIAIMLQLAGRDTKKLLITFIIVALLVNFSPVICGLVVDASNIMMNFFLKGPEGKGLYTDTFSRSLADRTNTFAANFWNQDNSKREGPVDKLIQLLVLVPFLFIVFFILLIFAAVFLFRYIAIWILVILSPIAFVLYVPPSTRKYFQQWWEQFINWCFIGVTCGFFLYLAMFLATKFENNSGDVIGTTPTFATAQTDKKAFDPLIILVVPVALLGLGLVFGLKTSAAGASSVIGFGKGLMNRSAKYAKQEGWKAAKKSAKIVREAGKEAMSEKIQKTGERLRTKGRWGEGETGIKGTVKRGLNTPYFYARRALGTAIGGKLAENKQDQISLKQKSLEGKSDKNLLEEFKNAQALGYKADQIAIINSAIKQGKINDVMDQKKFGASAITSNQVAGLLTKAKQWNADGIIKKAFPGLVATNKVDQDIKDAGGDPKEMKREKQWFYNKRRVDEMKSIFSKMGPEDYKNISQETINDAGAIDAMLATAMGTHIKNLIDQQGDQAAKAIENRINSGAPVNTRLNSYLESPQAKGLISIEEKGKRKVKDYKKINLSPINAMTIERDELDAMHEKGEEMPSQTPEARQETAIRARKKRYEKKMRKR